MFEQSPPPSFVHNSGAMPLPTDRIAPFALSERELDGYSLLRATEAARSGSWYRAGFEREVTMELARRAGVQEPDPHTLRVPPQALLSRDLTVASDTGGGYLAGDTDVAGVVDALRATSLVFRAGARRLTGLRADTTYARQGGTSTVTWQVSEATQATETANYSLGSISLTPKTVCAYVEESRLLRLMAPDLGEAMIRRDLRRTLSTALDSASINGTGINGQPLGLLNTSGIGTFTGASIAYDDVLEAQGDILDANGLNDGGEVSFACRPAVSKLLANRQGFSTNAPLWVGPLARGQLAGCPGYSSGNVPADTLIAGDFSQMLIGEFGAGLEIRVNPVAAFTAGIVGFGAFLSMDVAILNQPSFSVATSVS